MKAVPHDDRVDLLKAHVNAYTKQSGAVVNAHETKVPPKRVRFLFTDPYGNKHTVIVSGERVSAHGGAGPSGTPMALSNYMFNSDEHARLGYQGKGNALRDAAMAAHKASNGDPAAIRAALMKVSNLPEKNWAVKPEAGGK